MFSMLCYCCLMPMGFKWAPKKTFQFSTPKVTRYKKVEKLKFPNPVKKYFEQLLP